MDTYRKSSNIKRTVQVLLEAAALGYPVLPGWYWADPDKARDPLTGTPYQAYITLTWLDETAGKKGASTVQADVWTRIKAPDDADGDPFGLLAGLIADALEDAFIGDNHCFPILNYEANPTTPPDTGEHLLCINFAGDYGLPESRTNLGASNGLWRVSTVFRFQTLKDVADQSDRYFS